LVEIKEFPGKQRQSLLDDPTDVFWQSNQCQSNGKGRHFICFRQRIAFHRFNALRKSNKTKKMSHKRIMTSAIPKMSVAEVRKALGEVRKRASVQTVQCPLFITDMLTDELSIQEFSLKFVCGHHDKRHNKGKRKGNSDGEDDDEDDDENESVEEKNTVPVVVDSEKDSELKSTEALTVEPIEKKEEAAEAMKEKETEKQKVKEKKPASKKRKGLLKH
jgi:CBS domain-containing protein